MDINLYLKVQEPIDFYDICTIYQPSFNDILKYKISKLDPLLIPYCVSIDNLEIELSEDEKGKIKSFDLIMNSPDIFQLLFESLHFFCKVNIGIDEYGIYFEGFTGRLNRDNFDEFGDIILSMCARERPVKEKMPIFKNERQRDIWEKLQEGRKRYAKRNELKLEDVINICQYGGDYYIPKEEIRSFTLWEIMNCYKSKIGITNYKDSFSIYLVSGEKSLIEDKHWTDLIKLDYRPKE